MVVTWSVLFSGENNSDTTSIATRLIIIILVLYLLYFRMARVSKRKQALRQIAKKKKNNPPSAEASSAAAAPLSAVGCQLLAQLIAQLLLVRRLKLTRQTILKMWRGKLMKFQQNVK